MLQKNNYKILVYTNVKKSERVDDLLIPFDSILNSIENHKGDSDKDGLNP
jgi:hypothetical protein